MKVLNTLLYDKLSISYERLNLFLKERSMLENKIAEEEDKNKKKDLEEKLRELLKNKENHPYIKSLKEFEAKEKAFLTNLKSETENHIKTITNEDSKTLKFEEKYFENLRKEEFYSEHQDLSYENKLNYEVSKISAYYFKQIVDERNRINAELFNEKKEYEKVTERDIASIREKHELFKKEAKENLKKQLEKLRQKRRSGVISALALVNEKRQLKKKTDYEIKISELSIPDKRHREFIKSKEYELKSRTKVLSEILNKDIADIRTKTPVETEKQTPIISYLTILFPGLGQILNKQYIKGALILIGTLFIYLIAIPYALGYGNYQGEGLRGLITLAEGGGRLQKSLIYMIEGLVAVALLVIAFTILIINFKDNHKVEKNRAIGIRENNWFQTKTQLETEGFPYLVSLPALLITIFMVLIPISVTILLSFTNMDRDHQSKFTWIGLGNYKAMLDSNGIAGKAFWNILIWTLIWTVVATSLAIIVGFGLALIANNKRIKGKGIFRMIYLLPWAVPGFISILFFSILMSPSGMFNEGLNRISGFFGGPVNLNIKQDTNLTRMALIVIQTWLGSAYVFMLSTGVLQAIPEDLYEAAQIDGATTIQKTMKITLPLVLFQTMPLLIGQYTFNFNNFGAIFMFNGGGPFDTSKYGNLAGSSDLLISYIYKLSLTQNYQALAAAVTLVISTALMIFAYVGFKNSKAFKEERL